MSIDSIRAAQAYLQAVNISPASTSTTPASTTDAATQTFANLVQHAVSDTQSSIANADNAASAVVSGDANLVDVVTSVSAAEVSLETAIAVRNRMIEAYQEIMRMPI